MIDAPPQKLSQRWPRRINATQYDIMLPGDNDRHWARATSESASAALMPETRRVVRDRARYEVANNAWLSGIVSTYAHDVIGPTPVLQVQLPDASDSRRVEAMWSAWAEAVDLPGVLRLMVMTRVRDGEAFLRLRDNPTISPIASLDLEPLEADRVAATAWGTSLMDPLDGIVLNDWGRPAAYTVLREHPGDTFGATGRADLVGVQQMVHLFRVTRAEQRRGVSELLPALTIAAELRRYEAAVRAAAETAADFAMVMMSTSPPDGEAEHLEPLDVVDITRRMATTLPMGWDIKQIQAEQPTTNHPEYVRHLVSEMARPLNMPRSIALGDSSEASYASGRLDHQTYGRELTIAQREIEAVVLRRIWRAWWTRARGWIMGPASTLPADVVPFSWYWSQRPHVDPQKAQAAEDAQLSNGTRTFKAACAERGLDYEAQLDQLAAEAEAFRDRGLIAPTQRDLVQPAPMEAGDVA